MRDRILDALVVAANPLHLTIPERGIEGVTCRIGGAQLQSDAESSCRERGFLEPRQQLPSHATTLMSWRDGQ